jgi:hypothetical protein
MSIKLTLDLDVDRALLVLAYVQELEHGKARSPAPTTGKDVMDAAKRARKGRSDAGQPRGAYKPRETAEPTPAAPEPAAPPASAQSAPAVSGPAPTAAVAPTQADARAALHALNDVQGKGMDACLKVLKKFDVMRVSDMKAEKYAEFIAACQAEAAAK